MHKRSAGGKNWNVLSSTENILSQVEFLKSSLWGALVLYLRLEQKNQLVMVRLGRDVLEVCGVSQSTMMKQAMENTIKINPPVVMPVDTNGRFPYFILSNREGEKMERLPSHIREC